MTKIVFNIATVERRKHSLLKVLKCLANQTMPCNSINVAMSYPSVDEEVDTFIRENFESNRIVYGKFSCENKMKAIDYTDDAYFFTFDDDIDYPADYAEKMIEGIEKYERKGVVGFHGMKFNRFPVTNYHTQRKIHQYFAEVKEDVAVDIIGSGAFAFHTSALKEKGFTFESISHTSNVTDDVFSRFCRDNKIPMTVLAHKAQWMKIIDGTQDNESGWKVAARNGNVEQLKYLEC